MFPWSPSGGGCPTWTPGSPKNTCRTTGMAWPPRSSSRSCTRCWARRHSITRCPSSDQIKQRGEGAGACHAPAPSQVSRSLYPVRSVSLESLRQPPGATVRGDLGIDHQGPVLPAVAEGRNPFTHRLQVLKRPDSDAVGPVSPGNRRDVRLRERHAGQLLLRVMLSEMVDLGA